MLRLADELEGLATADTVILRPLLQAQRLAVRGRLAWHRGEWQAARTAFAAALEAEVALAVFGEASEVRLRLAEVCLRLGDVDAAAAAIAPVFDAAERDGCPGGALTRNRRGLETLAGATWEGRLSPLRTAALRRWAECLGPAPAADGDAAHGPRRAAGLDGLAGARSPGAPVLVSAEALSPREHEVLRLIAAGDSNKLIARAFDLSPHTVKRHVANILDKLGVQSRGQAAAWYNEDAPPSSASRRSGAAPLKRRAQGRIGRAMARARRRDGSFGRCPVEGAPEHCRHRGTSPPTPSGAFNDHRPRRTRRPLDHPSRRPQRRLARRAGAPRFLRLDPQGAAQLHERHARAHRPHRRRDAADREAALDHLDELLALCLSHLKHENEFVHTAIEAKQPAGSERIAGEHVEHAESIAALQDEAASLRGASGPDATRIALRLYRHLALFVAENFQHMHFEESVHNALLWQHYSDEELGALHGRLLASIPPQEHLLVARWMVPASTPAERAGIVGAAKAQMPPEALLGVMRLVRPHIDDAGWLKLAAAIGVDPMLGRR